MTASLRISSASASDILSMLLAPPDASHFCRSASYSFRLRSTTAASRQSVAAQNETGGPVYVVLRVLSVMYRWGGRG
eukprot:COSAG01_NODE_5922_length_3950_cov_3.461958_5_plen_77_part_00